MITIKLNNSMITDTTATIERVEELFNGSTKRISLNKAGTEISFRDYCKLVYVNDLNLEDAGAFDDALNNRSDEYYLGFADLETEENYYDFLVECREDSIQKRDVGD